MLPPQAIHLVTMLYPTLSGPIVTSPSTFLTTLPPPLPIETRSGILKFVLTPPTSTALEDCLGNPLTRIPARVVVPPTSTTTVSLSPVRNPAPLMLLVGPERIVRTGYLFAYSTDIRVPSFWLKKSFARIALLSSASSRARAAAFALSTSPMIPISWEREMGTSSPTTSLRISDASTSWSFLTGENCPVIEMASNFFSTIVLPISLSLEVSSLLNSRPSYSYPPSTVKYVPPTALFKSSGQSIMGSTPTPAGREILTAATFANRLLSTIALMQ